jgi:hypothetical protein
MKKITPILIFLFCMATAKGQEPAITMTTAKAVGDTISFKLAAIADNTDIQVDFGDGIKVDKTIGMIPLDISSTLVGSQTIKIYGSGIIDFVCTFNQLTTLDVSNNIDLKTLYCNGNPLTTLDLSKNIALKSLVCIGSQLASLDLTNNIALAWLDIRNNRLTTLDVNNKPDLGFLDCSRNQLKTLVVSNNATLSDIYCGLNQLTTLEVTNNPALRFLNCYENKLSTLDVSTNTSLEALACAVNQLTTIVLNNSLVRLFCEHNQLTFATLPHPKETWIAYAYAPQKPIFIGNAVKVGDDIDLGSQLTVNGNTTVYTWKTKDGATLTEEVDYTITNGITRFLKVQADSVYCEMTNATFPGFTGSNALKTTNVKVLAPTSLDPDIDKDNGLSIYPNPGKNVINVDVIGMHNADLSIYNALGILLLQQKTGIGDTQVNIGQLPKGIYMIQVTDGMRKIVRKIVKE